MMISDRKSFPPHREATDDVGYRITYRILQDVVAFTGHYIPEGEKRAITLEHTGLVSSRVTHPPTGLSCQMTGSQVGSDHQAKWPSGHMDRIVITSRCDRFDFKELYKKNRVFISLNGVLPLIRVLLSR